MIGGSLLLFSVFAPISRDEDRGYWQLRQKSCSWLDWGSQTQVLRSYTYTPTGLLDTASFKDKNGNTRTLSNTWDAGSNRVSFNANGTEYDLVYDTTAGIPAVLEESVEGGPTVHYIREPGGSLIARLNATDGIRYYHFDELGSTRLLTDATGSITDRYAYDTYGSLLSHDCYSGSVQQPYQYVGQLGYYTHWMEPDFALLQLGVRFYDPEVGRFGQGDPIQVAGVTSYSYAQGGPLSQVDPDGLRPVSPSDPRFPKKPCQASRLTLCRNWKCLKDSVTNAYAILRRHYPKVKRGEINGPQDAFRHCVWACLVRKTCGLAAYGAVEDHENDDCKGAKGHWDPIGSPMDLANDEEGKGCAGAGGTCETCCADKLHKGDLYILPPRYWK